MNKKIYGLLLILVIHLPIDILAKVYTGNCGGVDSDLTWSFDDEEGLLQIMGSGNMRNYSYTDKAPWLKYSGIKTIVIHDGVTTIGAHAFEGCSNLTSVNIHPNVKLIRESAFSDCSKLASITIPQKVELIGQMAFYRCSSLTSINIPSSVTNIQNAAFAECERLAKLTINCSIGNKWFQNLKSVKEVIIGDGVTRIDSEAFMRCTNLSSINIPESVKTIGQNVFSGCSSLPVYNNIRYADTYLIEPTDKTLATYNIKEGTRYIGYSAFSNCSYLASLTIPESVTTISEEAFSSCAKLTSITIPERTTQIGETAFTGCSSLTQVTIHCPTIGNWFSGLTSLKDIIIGENVKDISDGAFKGCTGLISANIPSNIKSVGSRAFRGCTEMTSLKIAEGVKNIGADAFYGCSSLTAITIPKSVTDIGNMAFYGCDKVKEVTIRGSIQSCGSDIFSGKSLKYLKLNGDISSAPFANMKNIEEAIIGEEATSIFDGFFSGCSSLKKVTLGKNIKNIKIRSFNGNTKLDTLICQAVEVPYCYPLAFDENIQNCTLLIPDASFLTYSKVEPWKNFKKILGGWHTLIYMIDGEQYKQVKMQAGETIEDEDAPQKEGYTFSGWDGLPDTMPAEDVTVNGTFAANEYHLTYIVDGAIYKEYDVKYDTTIKAEDEPTKEGFTFSGWNGLPEKMPAGDVTVTGTFAINSYTLTYILDGEVYKTVTLEYGSDINSESVPEKEGYTFSGWENLPETMPAKDVTVTGSFTINQYSVTFIIDGEVFETMTLNYGSEIVPPNVPEKENYDFSWGEFPETMPARDVTVYGSYTSTMQDCLLSVNGINGGTFALKCKTTATYSFIISPEEGWKISTLTFNGEDVTANLTDDSYTTPALTGNSELSIVFEHDGSKVKKVNGEVQLRVYAIASVLIIQNSGKEQQAAIYTTDGKMVKQVIAEQGTTRTPLQEGHVYLVKIGERTFKVAM